MASEECCAEVCKWRFGTMSKQVNVAIPESLREKYYYKCDREGQVWTTTLALLLEKYIDEEFADLFNEEE